MKQIIIALAVMASLVIVPATQAAESQSMSDDTMMTGSKIPDYVKFIAEGWVDGSLSDDAFIEALQNLIATDVIPLESRITGTDSLTIGFIPVKPVDVGGFEPAAEEFAEFLENQLGVDIETIVPSSYEPIIESLRFGHIDAAIMDTGPACLAISQSGAEVLMAEVDSGRIYYQATVWVSADNNDDIDSIGYVLGKKVSFTSETGSSGFVRPFGSLVTGGHVTIDGDDVVALEQAIDDAFESHAFPGSYGGAAKLLAEGVVDVAFGNDRLPSYLPEEERGLIKPALTLGPVPSHVLVVRDDMSENNRKALTDAVLKLNGGPNASIINDLYGVDAMLPTTTDHHMAGFCDNITDLIGFEDRLLDKYRN